MTSPSSPDQSPSPQAYELAARRDIDKTHLGSIGQLVTAIATREYVLAAVDGQEVTDPALDPAAIQQGISSDRELLARTIEDAIANKKAALEAGQPTAEG